MEPAASASIVLPDPRLLGADIGWRLCFLIGGLLGLPIALTFALSGVLLLIGGELFARDVLTGTALGGIAGPLVFGRLIETGSRDRVFVGYAIGAVPMILAALVQWIWGVAAERRPLERVARPLTAVA